MTDIEVALHRVLHDLADTTANSTSYAPNESDVARRVRRHRNNRRGVGAGALAAVVLVVVLGSADLRPKATVKVTTPPVSSTFASVPSTTTPVPTSTTSTQPIMPASATSTSTDVPAGRYSIVFARGESIVEVNASGQERVVAPLPGPATDSAIQPVLSGRGSHVMVTYLGRVFTFDTATWKAVDQGDFFNLGFVLTPRGFWAEDAHTVDSAPVVWREHAWDESTIGPPVRPGDGMTLIPFGAIPGGVAFFEMGTQRVMIATAETVRDFGRASPIAVGPSRVAFRSPNGDVVLADPVSGAIETIGSLGDIFPAETTLAGSFSPDGMQLAVATTRVVGDTYESAGIVVFDLGTGTSRTIKSLASRVIWTPDGLSLVGLSSAGIAVVDLASGESRAIASDVTGYAVLATGS
jgi:hypothetical protein